MVATSSTSNGSTARELHSNELRELDCTAAREKVTTFLKPGLDDEGYYRKPITEMVKGKDGQNNGQRRVIDWIPVAYFISDYDQQLVGVIGSGEGLRDMSDDEVHDETLWSWVCRHPIEYDTYVGVVDKGEPWLDLPKPKMIDWAAPADITNWSPSPDSGSIATDNTPPREKTRQDYQDEIEAACASAPKKVTDKLEAEEALGIKNRIAELRLEADKVGKAIYQPMHAAYSKMQKAWSGMVKTAQASEEQIDKAVRIWREQDRQRLLKEEALALAEKALEEERAARAADRAIARGEPEPEPEVSEIFVPPTEPEPIKPVYGRASAAKQEIKVFVTITDEAAVAAYFEGTEELSAVLQKLAEGNQLGQEVPGTQREGYA
jgi:hypothetical protein